MAGPESGNGATTRRNAHAEQPTEREEREAVRGPEGQGHVEGAGGEDRQLPECVVQGRPEVGLRGELQTGRNHGAEEGRGAQGRQGDGQEVVTEEKPGETMADKELTDTDMNPGDPHGVGESTTRRGEGVIK